MLWYPAACSSLEVSAEALELGRGETRRLYDAA